MFFFSFVKLVNDSVLLEIHIFKGSPLEHV